MAKILLADKHDLSIIGLKHIIENNADYSLLDVVNNEEQLFQSLKLNQPELIVIDFDIEDAFKVETIVKLHSQYPGIKLMSISSNKKGKEIKRVLQNGVSCLVTKECSQDEIEEGIEATIKGEKFFCQSVLDVLVGMEYGQSEDCSPGNLTEREIEIVRLTAQGKTAKECAGVLFVSHHTINTHRKNISKKLGLSSSTELVQFAINSGII